MASFAGSHRYVLDYLTQEVLARQPEQLVGFLLETAILERLSGPLCDAVTGRTDSQRVLEQVEQANLFVVPLDEVRGWWRYHHLFADLLRARLEHTRPERARAAAAPRPPGMRGTGSPTRPCGTLWPLAMSAGRPGWWNKTWRRCCDAAKAPRSAVGCPRFRRVGQLPGAAVPCPGRRRSRQPSGGSRAAAECRRARFGCQR